MQTLEGGFKRWMTCKKHKLDRRWLLFGCTWILSMCKAVPKSDHHWFHFKTEEFFLSLHQRLIACCQFFRRLTFQLMLLASKVIPHLKLIRWLLASIPNTFNNTGMVMKKWKAYYTTLFLLMCLRYTFSDLDKFVENEFSLWKLLKGSFHIIVSITAYCTNKVFWGSPTTRL